MTHQPAPDIVVIGAGVIGLSTAVCLAERGQRVEVRTQRAPTQTTSAVASAMIGPAMAPAGDEAGRRERASISEFTALAEVTNTGVTMRRGRLASREPLPAPGDLEPCAADEVPSGFAGASWAPLALVDMPVYLDYLARRLTAAGGRLELRSLPDLAVEAPLIVNCAGLGARELASDDSVTPVRGQHVIVDNPGLEEFSSRLPSPRRGRPTGPTPTTSCSAGRRAPRTPPPSPIPRSRKTSCDAASRSSPASPRPASAATRLDCAQLVPPSGSRSSRSVTRAA